MTAQNTPAEPVVIRRRTMVYPNNGTPHEMTGWSYKPYTKHEYEGQVEAARLFVGDHAVRVETTVELLYASPQPAAQRDAERYRMLRRDGHLDRLVGELHPCDAGRREAFIDRCVDELLGAQPAAQQPDTMPVGERELEDLAHGANQEALAYGVNFDVFMRLARTVAKRAAAPQAQSREPQVQDDATVDLVKKCRDALAEELGAWDIDPPLHHVKEAHDKCDEWLSAHGITKEGGKA